MKFPLLLFCFVISVTAAAQSNSFQPITDSPKSAVIPNFAEVHSGFYRGGRPKKAGVQFLAKNGIKVVINLENDKKAIADDKQWVEANGMIFISSPMGWLESPSDSEINFILHTIKDSANWPIFIHCKHGEDRTGLVVGLYRVLEDQWKPSDAYTEMLDLGFHSHLKALDNYFREKTGY